MRTRLLGGFPRLLAAATLVLLAASADVAAARTDAPASMEAAAKLLEDGQCIEARAMLMSLRRSLTDDEQRAEALRLLTVADQQVQRMDEVEVSLQKAALALKQGDLTQADRHADAARRSQRATPDQRKRASDLLDRSASLRDDLAPLIPAVLDQAVTDYNEARYGEAKAGFASVSRSGVRLSQELRSVLNRHVDRIHQLEREQGKPFDLEYVPLGVIRGAQANAAAVAGAAAVSMARDQDQPAEPPAADEPQQPPEDDLFEQARRFDAERLLAEANAAFEAGRYADAAGKYQQVTTLPFSRYLTAEQLNEAEARLRESRARIGAEGGDIMGEEQGRRRIAVEEAQVVVDNLMAQARAALSAGNTEAARNAAAEARLRWRDVYARGLLSEAAFEDRNTQIDSLLREIEATSEQIRVTSIEEQTRQREEEARRAAAQAATERESKVNESIDRLMALQKEQKYEDCLRVIDEILFLDPNNPTALMMKDIIGAVLIYRQWEQLQMDKARSYAIESLAIQEASIIPQEVIAYPQDWPEISYRRGQVLSFVESEGDRRVLATLESRKIPARFEDNPLSDVLAFIATVANVNMDVDWDSLAEIDVTKDRAISLDLATEIPARVVLDRVLAKASPDEFRRASWAVQDGIVVVASDTDLRKNTFIVIYDVRDLLFEIPDFDQVPDLDLDSVLNQSQQGGGGGGQGSIFQDDEDGEATPFDEQELLDRLLEIIQTHVDPDGWQDRGGDTGIVNELNGNLIIRNTSRNHRDIQSLLTQLRKIRNLQISVETRFLVVSQDFFEQIGFDLDVYFNARNNQVEDARDILEAFGVGALAGESVNLRASDLVGTDGTNATTNYVPNPDGTFSFIDIPFPVTRPEPLSVIPVQSGSDLLTQNLVSASAFAGTVLGIGQPALGIAGQFLDDIQVDFLVEATQADTRNVTLTSPRLTFTNGRAANIYVATQTAFISDLQPVVGAGAVAFDPTLSTANSGFTLVVRGVVSADRRYVTLAIQASLAEIVDIANETVIAVAGAGGDGGGQPVTAESSIQLPIANVTRVQTGVTIPDQGTILLGGQRVTTELEVETGVPVLSKIPIINRFFTNRAMAKEERTLLILFKPIILIQDEEEEKAFPGLLDSLQNPYGGY